MTVSAIRQFLKHPDCIIFVGSGVSMWSGLPNWRGLLNELATFLEGEGESSELVRRELGSGDLLQAASFGVNKLTPTSFGRFIRHAIRFGNASPHAIHKAIVELGPTAFITTNYDTLIEQALGKWRAGTFFPAPVTNKHLVELADIVSARSSNFIFKPHGDISDVSSVILTREQYRTLMPGGERQSALEALKTLLVTRPILYIGFGLRDPDFIYLRDLLLNIYQGAVRDHWAIMSDVSDGEADYWRQQYGIKLIGYESYVLADGSRDHSNLLSLIEALGASDTTRPLRSVQGVEKFDVVSEPERVLALSRYTAGLVRRLAPPNAPIEARIARPRATRNFNNAFGKYEGWTTTQFLTEGPQPAYLIGLPGSGKSFSIRLVVRNLAETLQRACMDDTVESTDLIIPCLVDLKLYQGALLAQIDSDLPAGFSIQSLRGRLRLKIFLDAFNEMPSDYLENGAFNQDLVNLKQQIGEFDYVITSRTADGLPERSGEPVLYEIARFEERHVDAVLAEHCVKLSGRFADDARYLLSRPFFLQLVAKGLVEVNVSSGPRDLLASFVQGIQKEFSSRFSTDLALLPIFSKVAYRAIEAESEAFPLDWLSDLIAVNIPSESTYNASDVVNWLIARDFLVSYTKRRVSFVHQSVTEYCAATELAFLSRGDKFSLQETISSKKWDQCLFLSFALMDSVTADSVLSVAIDADLNLAVNAVRYAEERQAAAVTRLLNEIIKRAEFSRQDVLFSVWLQRLPVEIEHIDLLRQLISVGDDIAGQAVGLIAHLIGIEFKAELFDLLELHADDYNFAVNGIVRVLKPMVDDRDLPRVLEIANKWLEQAGDDSNTAISNVLSAFEPQTLTNSLMAANGTIPSRMVKIYARALSEHGGDASHSLLAQLLLVHPGETTVPFYFSLRRQDRSEIALNCSLDRRHIDALWSARFEEDFWAPALSRVCRIKPDLNVYTADLAGRHGGIEAIALRWCAGADNAELLADVERLLSADDEVLNQQPFQIWTIGNLNWRGNEGLFVRCLARAVPKLCKSLLGESSHGLNFTRGTIGLALMMPVVGLVDALAVDHNDWWIMHRLGEVVALLGDADVQKYCLDAMLHGSPRLRMWVKTNYIGRTDLTTDHLDDDMIAALLADLAVPDRIQEHWHNPLGHIVTDRFVQERLIPLAYGAPASFLRNLKLVLRAAGNRHGKRYLLPS